MASSVNFLLVRTVFGAVLGMFYFGFNTGVVNAPEAAIKKFSNQSYYEHYGTHLEDDQVQTLFTVITSAFIGETILLKHCPFRTFSNFLYDENDL